VLRDYINATIGFEERSQVFDESSKSLMRMFGPNGHPQASNLFAVIQYLQEQEGIHLEVKARKVAQGAVDQCSIGNFSEHFEGFSEHDIFHGTTV
jgi:hypothetical protein